MARKMEEKIISMYAKGMITNDIESHMRELYNMDISDSTIGIDLNGIKDVLIACVDVSFDGKWSGKYPKIAKSRRDNWVNLTPISSNRKSYVV